MNPATTQAAVAAQAAGYPEKAALLAHQQAYQELAASVHSTLALIASKNAECAEIDKRDDAQADALFLRKEDLLAEIAVGKPLHKELEEINAEIQRFEQLFAGGGSRTDDLVSAVAGLKRKLRGDLQRLEQMRDQWSVLVRRFLLAEAEREGERYVEHAMALQASYRRLRALDHLRTRDKGVPPFTLVAGAGQLEVPSFDLEACKPYVDFTFKARLVTRQHAGFDDILRAAEALEVSLSESGVTVELPPLIHPKMSLDEPAEEAQELEEQGE